MTSWIEVGALTDIPVLGARVVKAGDTKIAVFRTSEDAVFALEDRCPHKNGPLSQGIVHGCRVTCPLHNQVIDLQTGKVREPDSGEVRTYPVRVENGRVTVQI